MIDLLLDTGAIGWQVEHACSGVWTGAEAVGSGVIRIGVHDRDALPDHGFDGFDILLTGEPDAPRPWVSVPDIATELAHLEHVFVRQPFAAAVLAQVLRMTLKLDFASAVLLESLAYSTLLASDGFRRWHAAEPSAHTRTNTGPRVQMERVGETLEIVLNRSRGRNAVDAAMRDALVEALEFARLDPERAPVMIRGEGAVFSIGGDLAEFGQAGDPAVAHLIRTRRSVAHAIDAIRDRATAVLHGPCIGAGIELPAAAGRVIARPRTLFRLPEVAMGLIPGAGGTVTIPRRIGRHRTCWMALGGREVALGTALGWGLVDAVGP